MKILTILGLVAAALLVTGGAGYFLLGGDGGEPYSEVKEKQDLSGSENPDLAHNCGGEGYPIACDEGNQGTVDIPVVGIQMSETDEKHHWDMESGMLRVIAKLTWTDTDWELEFSTGTGDCPDNGQTKQTDSASNGTLVLNYLADSLEEGEWFVHVRVISPESHRGESLSYSLDVKVFDCDETPSCCV